MPWLKLLVGFDPLVERILTTTDKPLPCSLDYALYFLLAVGCAHVPVAFSEDF